MLSKKIFGKNVINPIVKYSSKFVSLSPSLSLVIPIKYKISQIGLMLCHWCCCCCYCWFVYFQFKLVSFRPILLTKTTATTETTLRVWVLTKAKRCFEPNEQHRRQRVVVVYPKFICIAHDGVFTWRYAKTHTYTRPSFHIRRDRDTTPLTNYDFTQRLPFELLNFFISQSLWSKI